MAFVALTDLSGLLPASTSSQYTRLLYKSPDQEISACIAISSKEGLVPGSIAGLLLVLPEDTLDSETLEAAVANNFGGVVGPNAVGTVRLRSFAGRALKATCTVQLVDMAAPTGEGQADFDYELGLFEECAGVEFDAFGMSAGSEPTAQWLDSKSLLMAAKDFIAGAADDGDRALAYLSAVSQAETPAPKQRGRKQGSAAQSSAAPAYSPDASASTAAAPKPGSVPPLFSSEAARIGLSPDDMAKLFAMAGPAPSRLSEPGATRSESSAARTKAATAKTRGTAPVGTANAVGLDGGEMSSSGEEEAIIGQHGPKTLPVSEQSLIQQLLSQQADQNAKLIELLAKQREKPTLEDLLTTGVGSSGSAGLSGDGGKGFAMREAWKEHTAKDGASIRATFRSRLAEKSSITESELTPLSLKDYFMKYLPLGASDEHRRMTQYCMTIARQWELMERGDMEGLKTFIVLQALHAEQLSIELAKDGESEIPWFLTGLPTPQYHLSALNTSVSAEEPFAPLAHPKWINANLAYIRDLDLYRKRQKELLASRAPPDAAPSPGGLKGGAKAKA